jgi:hypothetical protein
LPTSGFSGFKYSAGVKARGSLVVLACTAAMLAAPAGAGAKPGYFVSPHLHEAKAYLKGSNGFNVRIYGSPDSIYVTAKKGTEQVSYTSLVGRLRNDRMKVHLPGVGRINLHFQEQSRARKDPPDNCKGPGALVRRGYFKGRVLIEGERDYTRVDARTVRGTVTDEPEEICRRGGRGSSSAAAQEELLMAIATPGRGILSFMANEWAPFLASRPVFFVANLLRVRGKMVIGNAVVGFSEDPRDLILARPPLSGSVDPPKPFTGAATFQREPGGAFTWLGDLATELPGIGQVSLAGPAFKAEACVNEACKGSAELEEVPFRYGSGSHSQPLALARLSSLR